MRQKWPRFVGPLLLILLYVLIQFVFPALGDPTLGLEKHRLIFTAWLLAGLVASGAAYAGLKPGARILAGAVVGLGATLLIPVWSGHGCWSPDLTSGIGVGIVAIAGGGAAGYFAPTALARLSGVRLKVPAIVAVLLVVAFLATSVYVLPPLPRPKLTVHGSSGPMLAMRRIEITNLLSELGPKPWYRSRAYYGFVGLGTDSIVQVVGHRSIRQVGLDGKPLAAPAISLRSAYDSLYTPQVAGDMILVRRSDKQLPEFYRLSTGALVATAAYPEIQVRTAVLTEQQAYLSGWEGIQVLAADGTQRWAYTHSSTPPPELRFRNEITLAYHPGSGTFSGEPDSCFTTPGGIVADLNTEIAALTTDGNLRWRRPTSGRYMALQASSDRKLVLALEMRPTREDPAIATGVVMALNDADGRQAWEWEVPEDVVMLDWASDGDTTMLQLDRRSGDSLTRELIGLSDDGTQIWRQSLDRDKMLTNATIPVNGGYLLVSSWQAMLVSAVDGTTRWIAYPGQAAGVQRMFDSSAVAIWHGAVVLSTGRQLTAYDSLTGAKLWEFAEPYGIPGIAATGDYLAVGNPRGVTLLYWPDPCLP